MTEPEESEFWEREVASDFTDSRRPEDYGAIGTGPSRLETLQTPIGNGDEVHKRLSDDRAKRKIVPVSVYVAGPIVLWLSLLPRLWYFLLRRIRELGDAIRGK